MNGRTPVNATGKITKIVTFDFEELVERKDNHWKMKDSSKMLLSASFVNKMFFEYQFYPVPKRILDYKKELGSNVMKCLEEMFLARDEDVNNFFYDEATKNRVQAILEWFKSNGYRIKAVEKFITDGTWCGFVDVLTRKDNFWYLFEIKCRNDAEVKGTDLLQVNIYRKMLWNIDCYLMVVNDNLQVTVTNTFGAKITQYTPLKYLEKFSKSVGIEFKQPEKINIE